MEELMRKVRAQGGFLTSEDVKRMVDISRLRMLLVRWHEGRALVPAQDVDGLIRAAELGGWTVRDVSLPSS